MKSRVLMLLTVAACCLLTAAAAAQDRPLAAPASQSTEGPKEQAPPDGIVYPAPIPPVARGYTAPAYPSPPASPYRPRQNNPEFHLKQAISHLRAAGKSELADKIQKELVHEDKARKLKLKVEQLEQLQREVDQLRKDTGLQQSVLLHVKILELHVDKMRKLGLDIRTPAGKLALDEKGIGQVAMNKNFSQMIEALRQHGLVKVLAEPTIVTLSGRPATVHSGGEMPVAVPLESGEMSIEFREFGTRVDCVPIVLGKDRIRLELRPSVTEIDATRSIKVKGVEVPSLRKRHVDTAVEMTAGQTVVLGGLTQERRGEDDKVHKTAMLLTVKAELIDGAAVPPVR